MAGIRTRLTSRPNESANVADGFGHTQRKSGATARVAARVVREKCRRLREERGEAAALGPADRNDCKRGGDPCARLRNRSHQRGAVYVGVNDAGASPVITACRNKRFAKG